MTVQAGALIIMRPVEDFKELQQLPYNTFTLAFGPEVDQRNAIAQLERGIRIFPKHLHSRILSEVLQGLREELLLLMQSRMEKVFLITLQFKDLNPDNLPDIDPNSIE